ncbi:hypothetical protein D3C78_1993500 [compost metagenome]
MKAVTGVFKVFAMIAKYAVIFEVVTRTFEFGVQLAKEKGIYSDDDQDKKEVSTVS